MAQVPKVERGGQTWIEQEGATAEFYDARLCRRFQEILKSIATTRAIGVAVIVDGRPNAALSIAAISLRMTDDRMRGLAGLLQREASRLGGLLEQRLKTPPIENHKAAAYTMPSGPMSMGDMAPL